MQATGWDLYGKFSLCQSVGLFPFNLTLKVDMESNQTELICNFEKYNGMSRISKTITKLE